LILKTRHTLPCFRHFRTASIRGTLARAARGIQSAPGATMLGLLATALLCAPTVSANPIEVDISFMGSGSVGGTAFTDQTVTLIGVGDTGSVVQNVSGIFALNPVTLAVGVSGFGTGNFTPDSGTFFISNENVSVAGFGETFDYIDFSDSAFATWDLQTSLGPVSGLDPVLTSLFGNPGLNTSLGLVEVTDAVTGSGTLAASTSEVPEPRGISLLLFSGGALLAILRTRVWLRRNSAG
jgi:hypothetical protein